MDDQKETSEQNLQSKERKRTKETGGEGQKKARSSTKGGRSSAKFETHDPANPFLSLYFFSSFARSKQFDECSSCNMAFLFEWEVRKHLFQGHRDDDGMTYGEWTATIDRMMRVP